MDASKKHNSKLVQVLQNFFSKALQIVLQARSLQDPSSHKINKWFNLHMAAPSDDWLRHEIKLWKSFSDVSQLPPMIIETYLDLRHLSPREIVVLEDDSGNTWTVAKGGTKKLEIVVERWLIEFDNTVTVPSDELPLIYKQAIVLLRVMYGMARLTPAYKLKKLLAKLAPKGMVLRNKFVDGKQPISSKGRIGLSKSIIPHQMLLNSHMTQRSFTPIDTTLGLLRVSVAYRNHHKFTVQDNEEMLSNHFLITDQHQGSHVEHDHDVDAIHDDQVPLVHIRDDGNDRDPHDTGSIHARFDISDDAENATSTQTASKFHSDKSLLPCSSDERPRIRPGIQPFKVGALSSSPGTPTLPSSMERRVSITSNRSGSNASLAALLRNPRGSTSSSNTPVGQAAILFPRSISSGSHLHDEYEHTPRFLSSFGSRISRRFSGARENASILGASIELGSSAPMSGLYIDDDISSFVRMIDGKSDLRLSSSNHDPDSNVSLGRFQLLKSQHQQLSESVSASLVFHNSDSKPGSRKLSTVYTPPHSVYSPPASLPTGSLEGRMPSINSRLHESGDSLRSHSSFQSKGSSYKGSYKGEFAKNFSKSSFQSNVSFLKRPLTSPMATAATVHAHTETVSGLSTTPSVYVGAKKPIKYEAVFDDDDEYMGKSSIMTRADDYDNDDLLFEMTDTK